MDSAQQENPNMIKILSYTLGGLFILLVLVNIFSFSSNQTQDDQEDNSIEEVSTEEISIFYDNYPYLLGQGKGQDSCQTCRKPRCRTCHKCSYNKYMEENQNQSQQNTDVIFIPLYQDNIPQNMTSNIPSNIDQAIANIDPNMLSNMISNIRQNNRTTIGPTMGPTMSPNMGSTMGPTMYPTMNPTMGTTMGPTMNPTMGSTMGPTMGPTMNPNMISTMRPVMRQSFQR